MLRYLDEAPGRPEVACFGIACPVRREASARPPTCPGRSARAPSPARSGIPRTTIINDFRAAGEGLHCLSADRVAVLQRGTSRGPQGPSPSSAPAPASGSFPALGGVALRGPSLRGRPHQFSPTDGLQRDLLASLAGELDRVSSERILSGDGLERIYRFLASVGAEPEQARVRREMEVDDAAAVIVHHAMAGTDALSVKALDLSSAPTAPPPAIWRSPCSLPAACM